MVYPFLISELVELYTAARPNGENISPRPLQTSQAGMSSFHIEELKM